MPAVTLPAWLQSIPPGSRLLTGLLIFFSLVLALLKASSSPTDIQDVFRSGYDSSLPFSWLVLVPGNALWTPWTLLTSSFCEVNLFEFLTSLLALPLCGKYLEKVWGSREFLKFCGVVIVGSNVIAVVVNVVESFVIQTYAGTFLYGMSYHGMMGLQVGYLVAFTQLIPEHQVMLFGGFIKMRVKQLPMLYVTFSNVMCILGYQSPFILIQFGWLVAWSYLRFLKKNEGIEFRGDRSETFAFKNWFPPFLQKPVGTLANFLFDVMVKLHVLQPWAPMDLESGIFAGPGGARAEAERRRAMALKALDQRLASKPATRSGQTTTATPPSTSLTSPPGGEVVFDAAEAEDGKDKA